MAINDIVQTIAEARVDARSLSEFVFKPASFMVARRLAPSVHTLQYYVDRFETIDSSFTQALNTANAAAVTATNNAVGLIDNITNESRQTVQNAIEGVAIDANLVTDALTTITPITNTAVARTQLKKNRESVSIFDFFTKSELDSYNANIASVDASRAIQEFFNHIAINNVGTADASGDFYISSGVALDGSVRPIAGIQQPATMNVSGSLRLYALNAIDTMLKLYNCSELNWSGRISVKGRGSIALSGRTCRVGVKISRSGRARFDGFKCENFNHFGLDLTDEIGNTSGMELGEVITRVCGSGARNASLVANYTDRNDFTSTPSPSLNRSHLTVDVLPPAENIGGFYRSEYFARIAGETYRVLETDRANSIISVHPVITENTNLTGTVEYVYGGGVNIRGSDSGIQGFGMIDAINCGIAVDMCSLYGPNIKRVISQSNGIGLCVGLRTNSAMVTYTVGSLYSEGNYIDIWQHTQASNDGGYFIGSEYALNMSKVRGYMVFYAFMKNGRLLSYEKRENNLSEGSSRLKVSFNHSNQIKTFVKDAWTIDMIPVNAELNRLFGYDSLTLIMNGSGDRGAPTGAFTFVPPSGWTVNGSANPVVFSNFDSVAIFSLICYIRDKDIRIACTGQPSKKQEVSVGSIDVPANSTHSQVVSVAGVVLGDLVQVSYTKALPDLLLNAYISATDTVTCDFINPTDGVVSIPSGALRVKSTKF